MCRVPSTTYPTQADITAEGSAYNAMHFLVSQAIARMATTTLVQVMAVQAGGIGPVGYVDVLPLVNQIDGDGNPIPHVTIHGLPYARIQGGLSALIIDPVVGDIGAAMFASHDISKVVATKLQTVPGSRRRFSMADGLYLGGYLNAAPTQYVQMDATGIKLVSTVAVEIDAPTIRLIATNPIIANGDEIIGGRDFATHIHSGVQSGSGDTGPPV